MATCGTVTVQAPPTEPPTNGEPPGEEEPPSDGTQPPPGEQPDGISDQTALAIGGSVIILLAIVAFAFFLR